MTPDLFTATLDAALQEFRTEQEGILQRLRDEMIVALAEDRKTAVAEARATAEAVAAEKLNEALARSRADAEDALATAEAIAAEKLSDALAEAQAKADEERVAAEAAAVEQLHEAVARSRAELEQALSAARADEQEATLAGTALVLKAVRDFDRARSLIEILDALADHISQETSRVAVLLVQGDVLKGWRFAGFGDRVPDPKAVSLPLGDLSGGVVLKAIRTRTSCPTVEGHDDPADAPPPFAPLSRGGTGLAVPIDVGGRIVAVVYADDEAAGRKAGPGAWPELAEILARHAARCLEALTAVKARAVRLASPGGGTAAAASPGSNESAGGAPNGQDEAARRYAKLLVSEIRLYHEGAVTAGRRERNLLERLGGEIERARGLYNARIPAASRADHFDQELVRTLADGDPALLGPPQ